MGDVARFERDHWGRAPLLRRAADTGDDFADVWGLDDLDRFLTGAVRRPLVRLIEDGDPIAAHRYTNRVRLGGNDFADVVDPVKVADRFADGATVVAQSLHRTDPPVHAFVEALAEVVDHPLQANAYLTPPASAGLSPHGDLHDVFVIQLSGTKSWTIDGLGEVDLDVGDVVYIPAHVEHSARATTVTSLHLTIGILRVTYRSVVDRILRDGPDSLDAPLPLRYRHGGDDLAVGVKSVLADVVDHLDTTDAERVAATERDRELPRPPRRGAVLAANAASTLTASSTLVPCDERWAMTPTTNGRIELTAPGRRLVAPAACDTALRQIESDRRVDVDDLRGLDGPSRLILARRLVRAGFCIPG